MAFRIVSEIVPATRFILLPLALSACIARSTPPDQGPGVAAMRAGPATRTAAVETPTSPAVPAPSPSPPTAPADYIPMHAGTVVSTNEGDVLLLLDESEAVALPIFIGGSEATSIRLRLDRRRYERPLTHDLFDALMHEVGVHLYKVQVDELKSNAFIGSVFVRSGGRIVELDARPSDGIALALGSRAPIFVACRVLEASAIPHASPRNPDPPRDGEMHIAGCPPKSEPGLPVKTTTAGI